MQKYYLNYQHFITMSWELLLNLLLFGMHYSLVLGTQPSTGTRREHWQGVNEHHRDLCVQSSYTVHREDSVEERSTEVLHEHIYHSYEKHNDDIEVNRTHRESHTQSKLNRRRIFKRGTMTKFINEWVLFMFILHCLFAGALLDHIGTHWNIQLTFEL